MATASYTSGPLFTHLRQGIMASAIGMVAIFLVDLVDMAFIAQLGEPALAAAVGFAGILLFFASAIGMALSVAASTLVSQALGRDDPLGAAQAFFDVALLGGALGVMAAISLHIFAPNLLALLGAKGQVLTLATTYFRIVNTALPLLILGMCAGAGLRGAGLVNRSMIATLLGGAVNAVFDPIFIFVFDWGLQGAAYATVLSRICVVALALYFAILQAHLMRGARLGALTHSLRPVFALALPSLLTSLSTPLGSAYVTRALSPFGADVIAGASVFGRLMPLVFVGIITLSMAMSPIIGQNFGAGNRTRVERTLLLAGGFSFAYALGAALILALLTPLLIQAFNLSGDAASTLRFYCQIIAFTYGFFGLHLAASQTFTNIGRPLYATYSNVFRDLILTVPFVFLGGVFGGPYAVITGQYAATILSGSMAYFIALRLVHRAAQIDTPRPQQSYHRPVTPYAPSRGH